MIRITAVVAALLLTAGSSPGQTQPSPATPTGTPPPRIGLVLSGGGARGAAHAGVLKVLERLQIPVHCVVGTSMGSIVGGLYAYGYSPAELERLLTREGSPRDWAYLLADGDGRRALAFRRKEETRFITGRNRFGVKGLTIGLPKGWIQGQNLETELTFLTSEAHDLASFDDLRLPFRCVAVDLGTGHQVVLDSGNLALAMRASMSVPGVFAPAVIDGRELLDGGLTDNVPIEVARLLGCDAVIAVDIGTPPADVEEVRDLLDVTTQMFAILTQQNVDRSIDSLEPGDLLLHPDLGDIKSTEFERARELIALGEQAAEAAADELRRFGVDDATWAEFLARQRRPRHPLPTIRSIRIDNHSSLSDLVLQSRLGVEPGKPVDEARLRQGLAEVYGTDGLQRVGFALVARDGDTADLEVHAEDRSWGVDTLAIGLRLESNFEDASSYEIGALYTAKHLNALGAELRTQVGIGNDSQATMEFFQPLVPDGSLFVAPTIGATKASRDAYDGNRKIAETEINILAGGIDAGMQFGPCTELRVGWLRTHGRLDVGLNVAGQSIPAIDVDDGLLRAQFVADTLDDGLLPARGFRTTWQLDVGIEELGGDADYQSLAITHLHAVSWDGLTLTGIAFYDTVLSAMRPAYTTPALGGFLALSGLPENSIAGQHAALGTLMVRQRLIDSFAPLFVGGSIEVGNVWDRRSDQLRDFRVGGSAFVAMDLQVAPLHIGIGATEGGALSGFLFLGPVR
ncbi:MAG: patatin-like phospholipase family protein [Planctomycetes bacterium]|nr:patatin-like phospholipase family protein [Planctomycetota bacterium]